MALAKPPNTKTFEDYARTFANTVYKMGATIIGIYVTFDCHRRESIKEGRRTKRNVIEQSDDMELENYKKDIAFCYQLPEHSPADKIVVVAGGFVEATTVKWSDPAMSRLEADHGEADSHT